MRKRNIIIFTLFLLFLSVFMLSAQEPTLIIGWEDWPPYQYMDNGNLTGLDIDLLKAILDNAGLKYEFRELPWKRHLSDLENGDVHIAMGASKTPEREVYATFSQPYRTESAVLFVLKSDIKKYNFKSLNELVGSKFQLGVTIGYYYGEEYARLIKNPDFKAIVQEVQNDELNYKKCTGNRINGFLADPVAGVAGLKAAGLVDKFAIHSLFVYSDDIYVMLSKKSVPIEVVNKFNNSLNQLKSSGKLKIILNKYLN